jgi:hypothetical protein
MCGRYASFLPAEAMARIFGTVNPLPNLALLPAISMGLLFCLSSDEHA